MNAGVTLLLVIALFMAVRRLRSFIPEAPGTASGGTVEIAAGASPGAKDGGVGTLLHDALLRARLAAASTPAESNQGKHLRSLDRAPWNRHWTRIPSLMGSTRLRRRAHGVARAMAILAEAYSHARRPDDQDDHR